MSQNLTKKLRRELQQTNIGLQLLFDNTQAQHNAIIYLQWCVAKPIAQYFVEMGIRNPKLFLQVFDAEGREQRYLFNLASSQELVQFRSPGKHILKASIVWGASKKAYKKFMTKDLGEYDRDLMSLIKHSGARRFCSASLELEVPEQFFAEQLSPKQSWWVNLLFDEMARNSCSQRRRMMFAYTLQIPLVAAWIVLSTIWRLALAIFGGVLLLFRVDWVAIVHPFEYGWHDVLDSSTPILYQDRSGNPRPWGAPALLVTPLLHLILLIVGMFLNGIFEISTQTWPGYFAMSWGIGAAFIIAVIGVMFAGGGITFASNWLYRRFIVKNRFSNLLCEATPPLGLRPVGWSPRLLYQRGKARWCKPIAV